MVVLLLRPPIIFSQRKEDSEGRAKKAVEPVVSLAVAVAASAQEHRLEVGVDFHQYFFPHSASDDFQLAVLLYFYQLILTLEQM